MGKVMTSLSMSLDGFVAGPNDDVQQVFAWMMSGDTPAVPAHAERTAAERGDAPFGLDVPAVNRAAVRYLQARGYRIDPFFTLCLSDEPLGAFDRYICTTPTFFI